MSATQDLETAFSKLDAVNLTEGETAAVANYLTATLTDDSEVAGFGKEPHPKGFLLEVSGLMKTSTAFGASWQENFTATDDLAR